MPYSGAIRVNPATGQKAVLDKSATLYFYPPFLHGRVTSPTITISRPTGTALPSAVTDAAMTVESANTTLTADSAKGSTSVTLNSIANLFVERPYILKMNSQSERVIISSIDTGTKVVTLADELKYSHENGSTFKGSLLTYALGSAQNAVVERNLYAKLKWVDEDTITHYGGFVYHVVHRPWSLPTTEEDVLRSWPDTNVQSLLRRKQLSLSGMLEQASDELVLNYLRPRGYSEDQFFDMAAFVPFHVGLIRRNLVLASYQHDPEKIETLTDYWTDWIDKTWERLLSSLPPYDDDNDGILDSGEGLVEEGKGVFLARSLSTNNPDGIDSDDFHPRISKVGIGAGRTEW